MADWYYEFNRKKRGPVSSDDFRSLFEQGTVDQDTQVWKQGMPEWKHARNVEELFAEPPPLPEDERETEGSSMEKRLEEKLAGLKSRQKKLISDIETKKEEGSVAAGAALGAVSGGCSGMLAALCAAISIGIFVFSSELTFGGIVVRAPVALFFLFCAYKISISQYKSVQNKMKENADRKVKKPMLVLKRDLKKVEKEIVQTEERLGYQ